MIYLAAIGANGKFTADDAWQIKVDNPEADALAYSEKFDRLYVAIDKKAP